jgi:hypothetical protein
MAKNRKGFKFKKGDFVESVKYPYYIVSTHIHNVSDVDAMDMPRWAQKTYKVYNLLTKACYEVPKVRVEKTMQIINPSPAMQALFCDKDWINEN